jgi:hypothetical protein
MSALKVGTTTKFEFGYGYDGGQKAWAKTDGVGCRAVTRVPLENWWSCSRIWPVPHGLLLEPTSCGGGIVRSGPQPVLNDLFGRVAQARDSRGAVVVSATYDDFCRHERVRERSPIPRGPYSKALPTGCRLEPRGDPM